MAVQHTLRIAGRAGGVTKRTCRALVEFRPLEISGLVRDQGLIAACARQSRRRHVRVVAQHHVAFELRQTRLKLLDQRHERRIEKQPAILGVIHYIDDLILEQPRIDRVTDIAGTRHAV